MKLGGNTAGLSKVIREGRIITFGAGVLTELGAAKREKESSFNRSQNSLSILRKCATLSHIQGTEIRRPAKELVFCKSYVCLFSFWG